LLRGPWVPEPLVSALVPSRRFPLRFRRPLLFPQPRAVKYV